MEDNKNINGAGTDPEVGMGAHDPQVVMASNKDLFRKSLFVAAGFVVILVCICTLQYCSTQRQIEKSSKALMAELNASFTNDSIGKRNAMKEHNDIAKNSNAAPAQRSKVLSARDAYDQGKYQEALSYIQEVSSKSPIVQTLKYCMEGDCYINLGKNAEGIAAFKEAVAEAKDNPQLAPYALHKLANVYRMTGDYKAEVEVLSEIQSKFPGFYENIDSELARAQARAGKK